MIEDKCGVLKGARSRIATEDKWCQGHFFKDADNNPISYSASYDVDVAKCCVIGAIKLEMFERTENISWLHSWNSLDKLCRDLLRPYAMNCPARYNNNHTHTEVLGMMDEAIEDVCANE